MDQNLPIAAPETPLAPEDFYLDGPNLVFTAAYHLKRGSCCGSGCRHCPYGFAETSPLELPGPEPPASSEDQTC
ncbi:MAG: DUF5522 domain-containing protein [Terracidiphilus sp.]